MTLMNVNRWIQQAQREGFAVGAFNANTMEQVQAIVQAAQAERAPVIVQVSLNALRYVGGGSILTGMRYMAEIGRIAAQSVDVPVALHLDHAHETEVLQALGAGFTSVMFDGGDLPLDENLRVTRKLAEAAHSVGAFIEAEVGAVPRVNAAGDVVGDTELTDPQAAAEFARAAGVDALAIAIGSVHSVRDKHVQLDLERLKAIRAVVDTPLVLHGSSGVTDDCIRDGIRFGLCKINVATQLNKAFTGAVRDSLTHDAANVDPRPYLDAARQAMTAGVRERLRFFGAAGKA
ncbi:MAG: class II fructose-bisphosphate aldolase [Chloroflexi bacterium]|nr:class II fructose-bisphosphate aldolase [Chloroflexota bacterium]